MSVTKAGWSWSQEPGLLVGQVESLLLIATATGLTFSHEQTGAIVAGAGAVARILTAFLVRSKTVPKPATGSAGDAMFAQLPAFPPAAADPSQPVIMDKPYGLHPMDAFPDIPDLSIPTPVVEVGTAGDTAGRASDGVAWASAQWERKQGPVSFATGIHDHPYLKLGLAPHGYDDVDLLPLNWLTGAPPAYAPKVDRLAQITTGVLGNDKFGDCEEASCANHDAVNTLYLTGHELIASDAEVLALYAASTKPPFVPATGANDNGTDMVSGMKALLNVGIGGRKIIAYAKLADMSDASIMAAIDLFGAVIFAVDLQVAQQSQTNAGTWDYSKSGEWGGHAIVAARYDSATGLIGVRTWGANVDTTPAFRKHQLQEVWVPIWPELVASAGFEAAVDRAALAADFKQLTGGTFPDPNPPAPTPTPTPGPAPDPDAGFLDEFESAYPGTVAWATTRAAHRSKATKTTVTPAEYLRWFVAGEAGTRDHSGEA